MDDGRQDDLRSRLARSASLLRSVGLNTFDIIEHLTYFLLLKFLDDEERQREQTDARYKTRLGDDHWRFHYWVHHEPNLPAFVGQRLFPYLAKIPDSASIDNSDLRIVFADSYLLVQEPDVLRQVINQVKTIIMQDFGFLTFGDIYEVLLMEMAAEDEQLGQFYTPRKLVDLMVHLAAPKIDEKVYDPAFGTAGLLVYTLRHIQPVVGDENPNSTDAWELVHWNTLYGREISIRTFKLGRMNLVFHGDAGNYLMNENSLTSDAQVSNEYDVIVSNLLFTSEAVLLQDLAHFPVQSQSPVNLFLQHVMLSLKPGGRAAVLVPEGVLFRSGPDRRLRERLLKGFNVVAVISLPHRVFAPYTTGKPTLLIFTKGRSTERIWFREVRTITDPSMFGDRSTDEVDELATLLEEWNAKPETEHSWFVNLDRITKEDYVLSASRYLPTAPRTGRFAWTTLDRVLQPHVEFITVDNTTLYKRVNVRQHGGGIVVRDTVYGHELGTKKQQVIRSGQVLVSKYGAQFGAIGVVPSELDGAIASPHYYVYDLISNNVSTVYLDFCLRSSYIEKSIQPFVRDSTLINYRSVKSEDILRLEVPLPSLEVQTKHANRLQNLQKIIDDTRALTTSTGAGLPDESTFQGYSTRPLGDLLIMSPQHGTNSKPTNEAIGKPLIRINNIVNGRLDLTDLKYVSVTSEELSKYMLHRGDLLVCRTSGSKNLVGKSAIFEEQDIFVFASYIIRFRINTKIADPFYISTFLNSSMGRREIDLRSHATVQYNISTRDLVLIPVPLPSLDIQDAIANEIRFVHSTLDQSQMVAERARRSQEKILELLFS